MLYPLNENHQLVRQPDSDFAIPLFKWLHRGEGALALLATLRHIDPHLNIWYKGVVQLIEEEDGFQVELWLGKRGVIFYYPAFVFQLVDDSPEGDRDDY